MSTVARPIPVAAALRTYCTMRVRRQERIPVKRRTPKMARPCCQEGTSQEALSACKQETKAAAALTMESTPGSQAQTPTKNAHPGPSA